MSTEQTPPQKKVKHPCVMCGHDTNHLTLAIQSMLDPDPDFGSEDRYMLVQCMGCGRISFRNEFDDFQDLSVSENGDLEQNTRTNVYPLVLEGHQDLEGAHFVPWHVRQIYEETLDAIKRHHYLLAAIGLRATIEAVCKEHGIEGRNLSTRIGRLSTSGSISKKDAMNLHAIRFIGNDAAHEIMKPEKSTIMLALEIIEHILETSYTLPARAAGRLPMPIETIDQFKDLIQKRLENVEVNAAFSLRSLLSGDIRRFLDYESLEGQLEQLIESRDFSLLEVVETSERQGRGVRIYKRRVNQ